MHKQYHLADYPMPEGFRIYRDRVPVKRVTLRKPDAAAFCKGAGKQLALEREPNNQHDPSAIRVIGSWRGWFSRKERMLGYVPAEEAAKLVQLDLAAHVLPRLLKTYLGADGFVEIEFQIIGPKDLYRTFSPTPPVTSGTSVETVIDIERTLARLDTLTAFLKDEPNLSAKQLERLRKVHSREIVSRMLETGEAFGRASGAPAFLSMPEADFRAHLRSIDNDLTALLEIVDKGCRSYFDTGEIPAPDYPWRVAVILSKLKMKEKEREFLAGWCRHFAHGIGARYGELVKRAEKLGVKVGSNV